MFWNVTDASKSTQRSQDTAKTFAPEQFTCLLGKKRAPVAHAETNQNRHNM